MSDGETNDRGKESSGQDLNQALRAVRKKNEPETNRLTAPPVYGRGFFPEVSVLPWVSVNSLHLVKLSHNRTGGVLRANIVT
jgi:hypothetical protein